MGSSPSPANSASLLYPSHAGPVCRGGGKIPPHTSPTSYSGWAGRGGQRWGHLLFSPSPPQQLTAVRESTWGRKLCWVSHRGRRKPPLCTTTSCSVWVWRDWDGDLCFLPWLLTPGRGVGLEKEARLCQSARRGEAPIMHPPPQLFWLVLGGLSPRGRGLCFLPPSPYHCCWQPAAGEGWGSGEILCMAHQSDASGCP